MSISPLELLGFLVLQLFEGKIWRGSFFHGKIFPAKWEKDLVFPEKTNSKFTPENGWERKTVGRFLLFFFRFCFQFKLNQPLTAGSIYIGCPPVDPFGRVQGQHEFQRKKKPHRNGVFSARVWLLGDNGIMERHKTSCNLCIPIFITSHQKEIQKNPPKHPPQMFLLGNLKFTRILESSWLKFQSNRLQPKMLYISNVWRFGNYNGPNSARKQQKHLDEEWNQANVHVQKSPRTIRK